MENKEQLTSVKVDKDLFDTFKLECVKRKFKNQTVTGNCAEPVPFASNIQFELHRKDSITPDKERDPSSYFVKIKYNGDYYHLCESTSF